MVRGERERDRAQGRGGERQGTWSNRWDLNLMPGLSRSCVLYVVCVNIHVWVYVDCVCTCLTSQARPITMRRAILLVSMFGLSSLSAISAGTILQPCMWTSYCRYINIFTTATTNISGICTATQSFHIMRFKSSVEWTAEWTFQSDPKACQKP